MDDSKTQVTLASYQMNNLYSVLKVLPQFWVST